VGGPKGPSLDAAIPGPDGIQPAFALPLFDSLRLLCWHYLSHETVANFPRACYRHGRRMPIVGCMSSMVLIFQGTLLFGDRWDCGAVLR